MGNKSSEFGFIFWVHLVIILLFLLSPFWLDWKVILFVIFLYYLQIFLFKDCLLTRHQFGKKPREVSFYTFLLGKFGLHFPAKKVSFFTNFILLWMIFGFSLFWQIILGNN